MIYKKKRSNQCTSTDQNKIICKVFVNLAYFCYWRDLLTSDLFVYRKIKWDKKAKKRNKRLGLFR